MGKKIADIQNFDFNAKFPRHDDGEHSFAQRGFVDPTGRTERVFRSVFTILPSIQADVLVTRTTSLK